MFLIQAAGIYAHVQTTGILCFLNCSSKEINNVTIDRIFIGVI